MKVTINNIGYNVERSGNDIICVPLINDNHGLVLENGYANLAAEAFFKANRVHQVDDIIKELLPEYVLENKEQLIKIEL